MKDDTLMMNKPHGKSNGDNEEQPKDKEGGLMGQTAARAKSKVI